MSSAPANEKRDIERDRTTFLASTQGKWTAYQRGCHELGYDVGGPPDGVRGMFAREEDAEFCAEAHDALPHYMDRCEEGEDALERLIQHECNANRCPPGANLSREFREACRQMGNCDLCWREWAGKGEEKH